MGSLDLHYLGVVPSKMYTDTSPRIKIKRENINPFFASVYNLSIFFGSLLTKYLALNCIFDLISKVLLDALKCI
jgi:hypothetical protein